MATDRIPLEDLPADRRAALTQQLGPISKIENAKGGLNSDVAARMVTPQGTFYVKGMRTTHPRVWTQAREAEVNPIVAGAAAPRLHWRTVADGWDLNVFEALDGHHADYRPGSPDLPHVAALLTRLTSLRPPEGLVLRHAEQRLTRYAASPSDLEQFQGDHLCHTDLNDENVLVVGARAWLVDWAWATRGAAWLDAAYWVIWLIAAGHHTALSAEREAAAVPFFGTASASAVTAFAEANANLWEEITDGDPDPWATRVYVAAQSWLMHRKGL
ncbi:aminoglycoside phosphotransferase [Streptomyces uncialis]|uniref:Aminoglycoside phosphotransferase n=1 Tax=Streptomyces uncialis TaxID=1048205 RepID=A0A1Q4VCB8_9ACTN|nr:aminoglycoside phosphotransferase [Streptomyces uncialis]OKH95399.1 aminoglycoside phosphotransferase [Streptomyces uncialis]